MAAQRNAERLNKERGGQVNTVLRQLGVIAQPTTPAANRVQRIRFVAGQWSDLVSPVSACRNGCSHCCNVSVLIPRSEAQLIAKRTGAKLASNPPAEKLSPELEERVQVHAGSPCTFLRDGGCSIYEHRPLACRTLVNMDDTSILCELVPNVAVPVPYANSSMLRGIFTVVCQDELHADIREWFPGPAR